MHSLALALPDGSQLAVQCSDGKIHFIDPTNGVESRVLTGDRPTSGIRFNASGLKFAGVRSNECVVYRTGTGERLFILAHPGSVTSLAWHPDGRRLATTCYDFKVRLWDTVTGQQLSGFEDHEAEVMSIEFDATGTLLASSSWDDTTRLWAPESARALVRVRGSGNGLRLAADASRIGYVSWDHGRLVLSEVLPGRELTSLERFSGIYGLSFSPDGQFIAAGSIDGLHLWQWPFFHPVATLPIRNGSSPAFLPDCRSLLAGGSGLATEWPIQADYSAGLLRIGPMRELADVASHHAAVIRLSDDGTLASLTTESRIRLFRRETNGWNVTKTLPGKSLGAIFSPDNRWLAIARSGKNLEILNAQFGLVTNLSAINPQVSRFSPDGRWLMTATADGYQGYQVGPWEPGPFVSRDSSSLRREGVAFCRAAGLAAFRTRDRELSLVDLETWKTVAAIPIPLYTSAFAFSPDGSKLGIATEKLGIQVWNLALVREGIASMNLDWKHSRPSPKTPTPVAMLQPLVELKTPRSTNLNIALSRSLPGRDKNTQPGLIDLANYYNASPHDGWIPAFELGTTVEHSLPIPLGTNVWAGIEFDVRGVIQLTSSVLSARKGNFPQQVTGIPIRQRCRRLHFLHGTDWGVQRGATIGTYVVRYVSGEEAFVPIVFGRDVLDWWMEPPTGDATNAPLMAWTGSNPASRKQNASVRVYRFSWENPRWDTAIQSIDFVSAKTACGPFLLAITAE